MSEPHEPSDDNPTTDEPAAAPPATTERRARWYSTRRPNGPLGYALLALAAAVIGVVLFGSGVLVGAELGDSEGHHRDAGESSDHHDGGEARSEHRDEGEGDSSDAREGDSRGDEPRSDRVEPTPPSSPTPHP